MLRLLGELRLTSFGWQATNVTSDAAPQDGAAGHPQSSAAFRENGGFQSTYASGNAEKFLH